MATVQDVLAERLPFPTDEGVRWLSRAEIMKRLRACIPDDAPNPERMIGLYLMGCERRAKEIESE